MSSHNSYTENLSLRKRTSLSIALLYIFIGLPVWYYLTKVDQYDINPLMDKEKIKNPYLFDDSDKNKADSFLSTVSMKIPVYCNFTDSEYKFPNLLEKTQSELDELLYRYKEEYHYNHLNVSLNLLPIELRKEDLGGNNEYEDSDLIVQLQYDDNIGSSISAYEKSELTVHYNDHSVYTETMPTIVAHSIANNFFFEKINPADEMNRYLNIEKISTVDYTPKIKLSFNLIINKNILADWSLSNFKSHVVDEVLKPYSKLFTGVYDFEFESNIIYNEDLNLQTWDKKDDDIYELQSQLDVSRLMNDDENIKQYKFIVVFPENESLAAETSNSNGSSIEKVDDYLTYTLPNWGNIFIYKGMLSGSNSASFYLDDSALEPLLLAFLRETTPYITASDVERVDRELTYTISKFVKRAILSNIYLTNKNIKAVYDMVHKLPVVTDDSMNELIPQEYQPMLGEFMNKYFPSLSMPKKINDQLFKIIEERDILLEELKGSNVGEKGVNFKALLRKSYEIYRQSEMTFFDGELKMGNFKSIKHIIAVYLPLLGPICTITIGGAIQLLKKPRNDPLTKFKNE